jgi:hypothetical protein
VAETVELRADPPELGGDELVVVDQLVLAERAARGRPGMRSAITRVPKNGIPAS